MRFFNAPLIRSYAGSPGCRSWLAGLAGFLLLTGCAARHQSPVLLKERASYVVGFGEFVEWPAAAFNDPKAPFVIGIFGPVAMAEKFRSLAPDRRINGREVVIRSLQSDREIPQCQVLFVSGFQRKNLPGIVARLKHASVLTVSEDVNDFNESGVIINLFAVDGKTLFEINRDAADRAGLKISSKLLTLAQP